MTWMQKFFSFEGRIGRQDFWICSLALWAIGVVSTIILIATSFGSLLAIGAANENTKSISDAAAIAALSAMALPIMMFCLIQLAMIWPSMAVNAKRFHDRGQSALFNLIFVGSWVLNFIPLIGLLISLGAFIWWLVNLGIIEGDPGPNAYGPGEVGAAEVFA